MDYKDLLNKRDELRRDYEFISGKMAELLEPVCYDVLDTFKKENIQFEVNGISLGDLVVRIPKLLRIKDYPGIKRGDYEVNLEDVKLAIKNLIDNKRVLETLVNKYSIEPVAIGMKK